MPSSLVNKTESAASIKTLAEEWGPMYQHAMGALLWWPLVLSVVALGFNWLGNSGIAPPRWLELLIYMAWIDILTSSFAFSWLCGTKEATTRRQQAGLVWTGLLCVAPLSLIKSLYWLRVSVQWCRYFIEIIIAEEALAVTNSGLHNNGTISHTLTGNSTDSHVLPLPDDKTQGLSLLLALLGNLCGCCHLIIGLWILRLTFFGLEPAINALSEERKKKKCEKRKDDDKVFKNDVKITNMV